MVVVLLEQLLLVVLETIPLVVIGLYLVENFLFVGTLLHHVVRDNLVLLVVDSKIFQKVNIQQSQVV